MPALLALFAWLIFGATYLFRSRVGRPTKVTLLEYQRGIRYRRGHPVDDVEPGQHWIWSGFEKTLFLDTRPSNVSYQNQAVTLCDGATSVYGFSASVQIKDVRRVMYSSQTYSQVPAFVLLCSVRSALNECDSLRVRTSQQAISEEISKRARTRFDSAGFQLVNFRITHLAIIPQSS
jgi:hypothetical protein